MKPQISKIPIALDLSVLPVLQKPLPKLPVPELSATLEKYLTLLTPVVGAQELEKTRQNVDELLRKGGAGEVLQNYLLQRQADLDNWVSKHCEQKL